MFLRKTQRKKDGKTHIYWSVVENQRVAGGRVVQRHLLYLGEINASQAAAWRRAVEVVHTDTGQSQTLIARQSGCESGVNQDERRLSRRGEVRWFD